MIASTEHSLDSWKYYNHDNTFQLIRITTLCLANLDQSGLVTWSISGTGMFVDLSSLEKTSFQNLLTKKNFQPKWCNSKESI